MKTMCRTKKWIRIHFFQRRRRTVDYSVILDVSCKGGGDFLSADGEWLEVLHASNDILRNNFLVRSPSARDLKKKNYLQRQRRPDRLAYGRYRTVLNGFVWHTWRKNDWRLFWRHPTAGGRYVTFSFGFRGAYRITVNWAESGLCGIRRTESQSDVRFPKKLVFLIKIFQ